MQKHSLVSSGVLRPLVRIVKDTIRGILAVLLFGMLFSCGWVDSTGRESNSVPVTQIRFSDGRQADVTRLQETESLLLQASGADDDGEVREYSWSDTPVEQGPLEACQGVADFDSSLAPATLAAACADGLNCGVSIALQSSSTDDVVEFLVKAPKLRAPVGATYELTATDNEGGVGRQRATFCMIAINEAPDAQADSFTVLEGGTLVVDSSGRNLLTNDSDDDHITNQPLRVLTQAKELPSFASSFSLRDDGGFTYVPAPARISGTAEDTFEYYLTDGIHDSSSAVVTVRIVALNDPPEQLEAIPPLQAIVGVPLSLDLGDYFDDPENDTLSYAIVAGSLPPSGAVLLSPDGLLQGSAEVFDEGSYSIDFVVSDGSGSIESSLTLTILDNKPVQAVSIPSQAAEVGETFTIDVSPRFSDPEGQPLVYSVDSSYDDAELSMNANTGVLNAVFEEAGFYTIDVSADDRINTPSSIRFVVIVTSDNTAPRFIGTIQNQTIELGDSITPISGRFSDADDDDLEYSVTGTLPRGILLSATGVLAGRPTRSGIFSGLRLVATDPSGEFARSNAFTIRVLP